MPRIRLLASAVALAICTISTAAASSSSTPPPISGVISFGDSLTDVGNVAALNHLPPGNSFTTNPDPETVQVIAAAFGFNQTNISPLIPGSNGTNYAYGGACVQANSATFTCGLSPGAFSITTQVTGYLAGGHADPHALYTMWGGANDIFTYAGLAGAGLITPQQAQIGVVTSARTEAGLIDALHHAGANNIIVFNLPDIGVTPEFRGTAGQASITGLSLTFNGQLNAAMAGKTGIIPVDTFGLVNEVLANPGAYGFSNVTDAACSTGPGVGGTPSSVACGNSSFIGILPYTYADGTNKSYFFADGVHPSGGAQALLAEAVIQEIAAPSYVSMLAETPLQTFQTTSRGVRDQMQADMGGQRTDGSLRTFASLDYSHQRYDQTATSPQTSSRDSSLVAGGDYYVNSSVSLGLVTTFTHQDASFGTGGGFQNNEPMMSAFAMWHTPDFYVSLLGSVGQLNFSNIDRVIYLGPAIRTESATTSGSHTGAELAAGYSFHWGSFKTGPFASIASQRVRVGSFSENGNDSTAMTFGRQSRNSTISKIGWEFSGESTFHPFARVAYEHEGDSDSRYVSAGLVNLNGSFSMPGYQPDSSYWSGELGMAANLGDNFSTYAAYAGHFGDSNQRVDSFNLGLKWSW